MDFTRCRLLLKLLSHGGFRNSRFRASGYGILFGGCYKKDYSLWGYTRGTPVLGNAHMLLR